MPNPLAFLEQLGPQAPTGAVPDLMRPSTGVTSLRPWPTQPIRPLVVPQPAPIAPAGVGGTEGALGLILPALLSGIGGFAVGKGGGAVPSGVLLQGLLSGYLQTKAQQAAEAQQQATFEQQAQEREQARELTRQRLLADFTGQLMERTAGITDPVELASVLRIAEPIYQQLGGQDRLVDLVSIPAGRQAKAKQAEARTALQTLVASPLYKDLPPEQFFAMTLPDGTKVQDLVAAAGYPQPPAGAAPTPDLIPEGKDPQSVYIRTLFEDFAQREGRSPTVAERRQLMLTARKEYGQADDRPRVDVTVNPQAAADTEDLAQMLVDGNVIPGMLSRRSASFNATVAKANRLSLAQTGKPLNLVKLQTDYNAAQRWVAAKYGPQMYRFRGLADAVVNTINEVRRLSDELKQGGVQLWNRAKRSTILQVYGNTPQSQAAAQYIGAVNTLKEEFANLAQGGYAPTEAAWTLANGQINADFGVKDLNASLAEVQRLINYRVQAFDNLQGPVLPGTPATPAAAPTAAPGPAGRVDFRFNPATGKLEPVK